MTEETSQVIESCDLNVLFRIDKKYFCQGPSLTQHKFKEGPFVASDFNVSELWCVSPDCVIRHFFQDQEFKSVKIKISLGLDQWAAVDLTTSCTSQH